jgi:hypothetical protein
MNFKLGVTVTVAVRTIAASCACVILAACVSSGDGSGLRGAEIAMAANLSQADLLMYAPVIFATANGGRTNADFVSGVIAQSAGRVHLLSYDHIAKSFRQDMSFEMGSVRGAALVAGPMGRKQLQIQTESGVVACEISGFRNGPELITRIYDRLTAAGAPTFEPSGMVNPVVVPQPLTIHVYIPASR